MIRAIASGGAVCDCEGMNCGSLNSEEFPGGFLNEGIVSATSVRTDCVKPIPGVVSLER